MIIRRAVADAAAGRDTAKREFLHPLFTKQTDPLSLIHIYLNESFFYAAFPAAIPLYDGGFERNAFEFRYLERDISGCGGEIAAVVPAAVTLALFLTPVSYTHLDVYKRQLQKAHQNAALVDFDMDIIQDQVLEAIRSVLGPDAPQLDSFLLVDKDPAQSRY